VRSAAAVLLLLVPALAPAVETVQRQPPPPRGQGLDPRVPAALARYDQGDKEGAKEELAKLRAALPNDGPLMVVVARELEQRQEYAAAEPFARRAVELLPDFAPAQNVLGTSLIFSDRVEEAERLYRAAVARFSGTPDEADLVFNLGMACALLNKRLEASEWFGRAIALKPKSSLFRFSAAENDRNLKRHAQAEAGFRLAMTLEPRHPDAAWKLAVTLAAAGRPEEAEPLFRSASNEGPPGARLDASFQYAIFLFERGQQAEALPRLEETVKARPADRLAWHYLARTLRSLGRKNEAAAALARFQALQAEADRSETEYLLELLRSQVSEGAAPADGKKSPERR
jgi:tetratricopeptide (TPR) repeat protein